MAVADHSIDPKILSSAKEEFLTKGYVDVSLREVCKKAGVTTGALYNRFKGKEALFAALIEPTLQALESISESMENYNYEYLEKNEVQKMWDMSESRLVGIIEFFYEHYDGLRLLLCCSEGSTYSNFLDDFVSKNTKQTMKFIDATMEKGVTSERIDEEELHMLLTAYWATLLEPIVHDFPKEKALLHSKMVAKFFNWQAVLGF